MEHAILKTLAYADLFDLPFKSWEIHRWLIGQKCSLAELDKSLKDLSLKKKIFFKHGLYYLKGRDVLVSRRAKRAKLSEKLFQKAKLASRVLRLVPWIGFVGITGSLSLSNAQRGDDIDLLVIASSKRVRLSRLFSLSLLELLALRRRASERTAFGKIDVKFLSGDFLEYESKDIFFAHEILRIQPLWQRDEMYHKFLYANSWVFEHLPNWISSFETQACKLNKRKKSNSSDGLFSKLFDKLDIGAGKFQEGVGLFSSQPRFNRGQSAILAEYTHRLKKYKLS